MKLNLFCQVLAESSLRTTRLSIMRPALLSAIAGRRPSQPMLAWRLAQRGMASSAAASAPSSSSSSSDGQVKTGILMLNMGGPSTPEETGPFLKRLFTDGDIIELGGGTFQQYLGNFIASRRTPKVAKQYEEIGGSPIRKWTEHQGEAMCRLLDEKRPESAPHKAYTCFRYAHPLTEEALEEMKADGVDRVVAFSQFPQWSCTTSGSSMNELWRQVKSAGLEEDFKWSLIDRWPLHGGFIDAVADRVKATMLKDLDEESRSKAVIVFSAHSVPMKVVGKGDHYVPEVCASVKAIMEKWTGMVDAGEVPGLSEGQTNKHVLAWQSKVGFLPWMTPSTSEVIASLGSRGVRNVVVVPVAFTSDHVETLFEIGIEYAEEAEEAGITNFTCTEGLNGSEIFIEALADIVDDHLESKKNHSSQYKMKCLNCTKPLCRQLLNPAFA